MQSFRYRRKGLIADYVRSGAGLVVTGVPLSVTQGGLATWVLGALMAIFAGFGLRTALRGRTTVDIDADAIAISGPMSRRIAWASLQTIRLSYYTTNKQNLGGWMQLTVHGAGATIKLDSTLDGFKNVVERVVAEALERGVELPAITRANLEPLGIRLPKSN